MTQAAISSAPNQTTSPDLAALSLTGDQRNAVSDILNFLMSEETFFTVSGPAGVGKTFLMDYIAKYGRDQYKSLCKVFGLEPKSYGITFTATTHKAAQTLEEAIGQPVTTIQSFLGLRVRNDFQTGKQHLSHIRPNDTVAFPSTILVVDEASMVSNELFKFINDACLASSKVIFIGDHAQLAPIGEVASPVFDPTFKISRAHLRQVVRNASQPALMDLCTQLRTTVETGIFAPITEVPGVIDYLDDDTMQLELEAVFTDPDPDARMLCYTNSRVADFAAHIREEIRGYTEPFEEGEHVVTASTFIRGKTTLNVERSFEILQTGFAAEREIEIMDGETRSFRYRNVHLRSESGAELLNVPAIEDHEAFKTVVKRLKQRKKYAEAFDLTESYLDLRNKAVSTVHKAQGSTYGTVFIDIGNLGRCREPDQFAQMLYVAVSRARTRVCLYGQLPGYYHNSQGRPLWTPLPSSTP